LEQVLEKEDALGLLAAAFADGEQAGEAAPGIAVLRIGENVRRAVREAQPRADDEFQCRQRDALGLSLIADVIIPLLELAIGAHHAGDAVAISDADTGQAQREGLQDELFWMRRAAQEREIGRDRELRIGGRAFAGLRLFVLLFERDYIAHAN